MSRPVLTVLAFFLGPILGWYLLVGFCSIPGIAFSNACGHNAYLWLPIFIPTGIAAIWFLLKRLFAKPEQAKQS